MKIVDQIKKKAKNWKITEVRAISIIMFIGVATIVTGIFQINKDINLPFNTPIIELPEGFELPDFQELVQSEEEQTAEALEKLKEVDTDEDGLSNFDELYIYTTSPYLYDSDSDGKSDQEEVEQGEDPNCPSGQQCNVAYYQPGETELGQDLGIASSSDLRATLQGVGVPQSVLDSMDDATLQKLYQDTVEKTGVDLTNSAVDAGLVNTSQGTSPYEITYEVLGDFQAPQIRELLKESGLDEETINQVDDATLEYMYQKVFFGPGSDSTEEGLNINL